MTDRDSLPDFAVPPGETIKELLDAKQMSPFDLAQGLNLFTGEIIALMNGRLKISQTLARNLEKVFDVPESFWLNLQAQHDAAKKREGTK